MSDIGEPKVGQVLWRDLTVKDAPRVRDFYQQVVGWTSSAQDMGGYEDFNMMSPDSGETVAGICHARGSNTGLPAQWLIYVIVEDVDASARKCVELGGKVLNGPRKMGGGDFCVIQDPAGAVCALYRPAVT
jgi:predicted enzyme related to lactoylglutathione lyase